MNRLIVFCFVVLLGPVFEAHSRPKDLTELLPSGTVLADVLNAAMPKRQLELTRKMEAGVRENRDWFEAYMVEQAGKRPLPYHENFGLSKADYKELVSFTPADGKFVKVGFDEVDFRRPDLSSCTIHGVGLLSKVPIVTIDQNGETVKFPGFPAVEGKRFRKFKNSGPVGPMDGQRWMATDIKKPGGDGTIRSLALLAPHKEKFLYFDFVHRVFKGGKPVTNERLIFRVAITE